MKLSPHLSAVLTLLLLIPSSIASSTHNVTTTANIISSQYATQGTTTATTKATTTSTAQPTTRRGFVQEFQETLSSSSLWLDYEIIHWSPPSAYHVVTRRLQEQQQQQLQEEGPEEQDDEQQQPQELEQEDEQSQAQEEQGQIETGREAIPEADDLIVTVTFRDIYKVILFIAVAWLLGAISVYIGLPSLVGEIVAGFLLGPPLADFVPFPGALVLTGNLGLIGLILESGIALDVAQLKEVGKRALLLAIVGSTLPLLTGFGLGRWIGKDVKSAIAVGAAFAPSSLGVASNALSSGDVLNTPIGQMIVASSVFDDVFGLILLSILEVFADPDPTIFQYILPFLASFGYLIVLGLLGITVLPTLIEDRILPLVSEGKRDQFAMVLMLCLMIVYMLALNYSGASYLTGVFLAGLTFSQLHFVHASFVKQGRPLLNWLLRIFFAATIGFQVPITSFGKPYVVKWGFALLLAVVAKVPLGLFVPHFQKETPDDFPYNPYIRDVLVTSLAMTCRGEFNVIVASYALSEGLFHPDVYSAVIFAILFGSIVSPLVLSKLLRYYNDLSLDYLEGQHPIERIGSTCDGYRPLFMAIQARTPVHWNLQEDFEKILGENGLIIIDHRTWHTLGRKDMGQDPVDITELFVQDTKVKVKISGCFDTSARGEKEGESAIGPDKDSPEVTGTSSAELSIPACVEEGVSEEEEIQARCDEIKTALSQCLKSDSPEDYVIQVSQWQTFVVKSSTEETNRQRFYSFHTHSEMDQIEQENDDTAKPNSRRSLQSSRHRRNHSHFSMSSTKARHRRSRSHISTNSALEDEGPTLSCADLWELDNACHDATREGFVLSPESHGYGGHNITAGLGGELCRSRPARHQRAVSFDASLLIAQENDEREMETRAIRDRLCGYVRHHALPELPES